MLTTADALWITRLCGVILLVFMAVGWHSYFDKTLRGMERDAHYWASNEAQEMRLWGAVLIFLTFVGAALVLFKGPA